MNLPYSEACEQNRDVILKVLIDYMQPGIKVLEVGSGTGQHAVYFAGSHPQIHWQTSDQAEYLPGIKAWVDDAELGNLPEPILLDVCQQWPNSQYDLIFSANTLHIMDDIAASRFISHCHKCLKPGGNLIIYGPFNYNNAYTSESNRNFDQWLKNRDPASGIKHFEWVNQLAIESGFRLIDDFTMPANNRSLVWQLEPLPA